MIRRSNLFLAMLVVLFAACSDESAETENTSTTCADKLDNDGDGKTDCDDADCKDFKFCDKTHNTKTCGDGEVGQGETCDTGITFGAGVCPTQCDDSNDCTVDTLENPNSCTAACKTEPITQCVDGDSCCPSGCDGNDNDCKVTCGNGVLDIGESCDTKIAAGKPGACPTECDDGNACTKDTLISGATCDASCSHEQITACSMTSDGCCPTGCDAKTDSDCSATCGNGLLDLNEKCDTKIAAGLPGVCPTACDDGIACTTDTLLNGGTCGAVCSSSQIMKCQDSDGCCPSGCDHTTDNDCSATCGNGTLELNETCDTKIAAGKPGACPTTCDDGNACTLDHLLNGGTCGAVCSYMTVTSCSATKKDGCCPAGCDASNDSDCSATCGNGVLEPNETCDTKIAAGQPGVCPTTCDDGAACTLDELLGAGTCNALCSHKTITGCSGQTSDSCCPAGCDASNDSDCSSTCGNGVLEPTEKCDIKIPSGQSGACPTYCDDSLACTKDQLLNAGTCDAVCQYTAITGCSKAKDGCCPSGCNANTDPDCSASCGNGVVDGDEKCDIKIPAGMKGACPTDCDDKDPCTKDTLLNGGTCDAVCSYTQITSCSLKQDGCCPKGCYAHTDADCKPVCGNGVYEPPFETCDIAIKPPAKGACPLSCDDGNPCTTDKLEGTNCTAKCTYSPLPCSGSTHDKCCNKGCDGTTDIDCAKCGNGVVELGETCDTAIPVGTPGYCPKDCDDKDPCTTDTLEGKDCTLKCSFKPFPCSGTKPDKCCPKGCDGKNDIDCAKCGNGIVELGETCDIKIPTGMKGSCPTKCDDGNPCTNDSLAGSQCTTTCSFKEFCSTTLDKCCPNTLKCVPPDPDCGKTP